MTRSRPRPATRCIHGCVGCCDPVILPYTQDDVARLLPGEPIPGVPGGVFVDAEDRRFVLEDLTPIRRRDGLAMVPWMDGRTTWSPSPTGPPMLTYSHFYSCKHLDPVSKRCRNYDRRPPLCRGYPWYGTPPDPRKSLPPFCGYLVDVGVEPQPIPVTITRRP